MTNAAKEVQRLQNELNRISTKTFPKADQFEKGIQKAADKVSLLEQKLKDIQNPKVETSEFQKISQELDAALEKLDRFYMEANERISGLGLPEDTDPTAVMSERAKAEFEAAIKTADQLQEKYDALRASGQAWEPSKEYTKTSEQLDAARADLSSQERAYEQAKADFAEAQNNQFSETSAQLETAKERVSELSGELRATENSGEAFKRMGRTASAAMETVKKATNKAKEGIKSLAGHIASETKSFTKMAAAGVKNLTGIGKESRSSGNLVDQFGKRIWGLAKRVFVFSLITKAFRAVRSSFAEGVGYYLSWDKALNSQVQALKNSVLELKANFGGAFAPLVEMVVPVLQTIVGWLNTATNAVGAFIAAITGKSTYKSVVAGTAVDGSNAAKSVGDTTDAVKKLKKELADYDELHVITKDDDSSSAGTGTGGGSSITPQIQYQDVDIGSGIKDFANKIKEAWKNADFTEIGEIIGKKLKDGLDKIPWAQIQETAGKIGKSFATLINGFISVPGLAETIGRTLGEAINTGIILANSFVHSLEWKKVGSFLAEAANSFFKTWDAGLTADTFKTFVNGIADSIYGFASKFNWGPIGSKIGDCIYKALVGINWRAKVYPAAATFGSGLAEFLNGLITPRTFAAVGTTIANALNTALQFLGNFGRTFNWSNFGNSLGSGLKSFLLGFNWDLAASTFSNLVSGIATAIRDAIRNFAKGDGFYRVGLAIGNAFQKIDYSNIFSLVAETIWDALNAAIDLAKGLFSDTPLSGALEKLKSTLNDISKKIDFDVIKGGLQKVLDVGLKFGAGFLSGLVDALGALAKIGWAVLSFIGKAFGTIGDGLSKIDPDLAEKIGHALGVIAVGLGAIILVSKVQLIISGIAAALTTAGVGGAAGAAGISAASGAAQLAYTSFANLKGVLSALFSPGGLLAMGIVGAVELGKGFQLMEEKARGGNGQLSEMGGIMDSIGQQLSPKLQQELFKLKEKLEDEGASADECAAAFAEFFQSHNISPDRLKNALGTVGGQINVTDNQAKLINATIEKMGTTSEKTAKKLNMTEAEYKTIDGLLWDVANSAGLGTDAKIEFDRVLSQFKAAGTTKDAYEALIATMETMGIDTKEFTAQMKTQVPSAFKQAEDSAKNMGTQYDNVAQKTKAANDKTGEFGTSFGKFIGGLAVQLLSMLGIGTSYDTIGKKATEAQTPVNSLWDTIKKAPSTDDMKSNGQNLMAGYKAGIETEAENVKASAVKAVKATDEAVKTSEGIHSPSTVWEGFGKNLMAGMVNGLTKAKETLTAAVKTALNGAKQTVKAYGDITFKLKPEVLQIPSSEIQRIKQQLEKEKWYITLTAKDIKDSVPDAKKIIDRITGNITKTVDKVNGRDTVKVQGDVIKGNDKVQGKDRVKVQGDVIKGNDLVRGKDRVQVQGDVIRGNDLVRGKDRVQVQGDITKSNDRLSNSQKQLSGFGAFLSSIDDRRVHSSWKNLYDFTAYIDDYYDKIPWSYKVLTGFQAWISSYSEQAKGGVFKNGSWQSLPQYASGGAPTHGTIFAAGENGAEVVGTIGGRTEVLNRSQIAMAIYQAVKSALAGFGTDIVQQIAYDAGVLSSHLDMIPERVSSYIPDVNQLAQANRAYTVNGGIDYNRLAQAMAQTSGGGNGTYVFTANLDGREIFRETVSQNELYRQQTGRSALA